MMKTAQRCNNEDSYYCHQRSQKRNKLKKKGDGRKQDSKRDANESEK